MDINREHQVLLTLLEGDVDFSLIGDGVYETMVTTRDAKTALNKENRFARLNSEGVTPVFKFRGQEAPITDLIIEDGNDIRLKVLLDPLTMLPKKED